MKSLILSALTLFFSTMGLFAQAPSSLPRRNPEPLGFFDSTTNIVFYVVLPVIIGILYFIWKRNTARMKQDEEQKG
jgi:heme/copper-type cytochrome/quinol oxidase subunit 2